ncbi:L-lactate dehydrogenase-like isoform X2 [Nasonia vitripennis]|nr:L-lactate dehydrogenase-like isoform X2 [Nasonia vitripennis]
MARFLLSRPVDCAGSSSDSCTLPRTKIVIVGSGPVGVAVAVGLLFKRLAAELILMDENPEMARAEAEDIAAAAVFLGSPKIRASTDYSEARDATLCVIAAGRQQRDEADAEAVLQQNALLLKELVPSLTKYAPNSVLLVVSEPVDVLSHLAMKLSGFPSQRVLGLGTLLDNCRLQHELAKELGVNQAAVHSMVIAESGPTSVPIWSAASVMGMKLKDIDKDIGDPEGFAAALHAKVVNCNRELIRRKGQHCWAAALCTCEIIDAIVRNTCACLTVSTFVKGCRHGLEKDVFASLPCVLGRGGVLAYMRHLYTPEEQELTSRSCRRIYEAQKSVLGRLEE